MTDNIFKAYDIRGIYPQEINKDIAYQVGKAFVIFLGCNNPLIVIGRDARLSSLELSEELKRGLEESGARIIDIGLCTTPLLNFSTIKLKCHGGIMITASHNPKRFNGFKLIKARGLQMHDLEIQEIKNIIYNQNFKQAKGKEEEKKVLPLYIDHIKSFSKNIKDLKIVCDFGNGTGAITAKPVFSLLPIQSFFIFDKPDGNFPNHLPNPLKPGVFNSLAEKVIKEKADLGIFFDGDADRSIFVDEEGKVIPTDFLFSLLVRKYCHKGQKVYYDLRFSRVVLETIKEQKGIPVIMRVGNPFYKEKIILEKGLMGGEFSGHTMFLKNFGIDDGLFAAICVLDIMSKKKEKISNLIKPFDKYFQSPEISLKVSNKKTAFKQVRKTFKNAKEISLDGLYFDYGNWWFNLRESNTENLIRLRLEADSQKLLKEKQKQLLEILK